MSAPEVTGEIDQNGQVTVEVSGVQGPLCKEITKELEQSLGKVTATKLKPEHQHLGTQHQQEQKLGE